MSNNNFIPIQPIVPFVEDELIDGTLERDGEAALDPDAADENLTSAEADRLAAERAADEADED